MTTSEIVVPILFLAAFVPMWAMVTIGIAAASGGRELARLYPNPKERPLLVVGGQSGSLGPVPAKGEFISMFPGMNGCSFRGCLNFAACPSGLQISVWWVFGPAERPFLVPWDKIEAGTRTLRFFEVASLGFAGSNSRLDISPRTWRRLAARRPGQGEDAIREADRGAELHHLKRWGLYAAFLAAFFSIGQLQAEPVISLGEGLVTAGLIAAGLIAAVPSLLGYIGEKLGSRRR